MKLTSVSELRELMERHNLKFNKGYGQNFLINEAVPKRIAAECGADSESGILEIGPGVGTLTRELCQLYKKVVAVEIDTNLIPALKETTAEFDNFKVINSDILKLDIKKLIDDEFNGMNVTVCANLPYYITTPIIMSLLESGAKFENITVMIQKEVALRLCAAPASPEYGAITVSVMRYGKASRLFNVSAGSFMPAPKVDSAVVRIKLGKTPTYNVKSEELLTQCIRGGFAQRRKTLVNSLSSEFTEIEKGTIAEIIAKCGFVPTVRGETLSVNDYARLADAIYDTLH